MVRVEDMFDVEIQTETKVVYYDDKLHTRVEVDPYDEWVRGQEIQFMYCDEGIIYLEFWKEES